jgi:hypothetical protein
VSCSIFINIPSSMSYGCGFISFGSIGNSFDALGYLISLSSGLVYVISACGLAMDVCSMYSSTDCRPFWYLASNSITTFVPRLTS